MKNLIARAALILAGISAALAQPTIPVNNLSPITGPSVIGKDTGTGRAIVLPLGSGLSISGGLLISTASGGAPTNATFITQTPNATLTNEQALSALSTGLMFVTTTTGVITSLGPTLPAANGGFGMSVSGSSGVPLFASGTPTFTSTSGTGVFARVDSPLFTTKLTLATSATPSTTAAGEVAFDTNAWAASRGAIQIFDGTANTNVIASLASDTPTNGQVPTWNTGGTITWETPATGTGNVTNNATLTSGRVVLGGGTTTIGVLGAATDGQILIGNSSSSNLQLGSITAGANITVTPSAGGITIAAAGSGAGNVVATSTFGTDTAVVVADGTSRNVKVGHSGFTVNSTNGNVAMGGNLSVLGNITVANMTTTDLTITGTITGVMPTVNGGTGFSSTTLGNIILGNNSTTYGQLGVGANGRVLTANSSATLGVSWDVIAGGGNISGPTMTANAVVVGAGTTTIAPLASLGTSGHPLVSAGAGAPPAFSALTVAGGGTSLTTITANSIVIGNGTNTPILLAPGTSGNVVTSNGTAWTSAPASGGGGATSYILIQDQKTSGTAGGTFTSGAWRTRDLNTEVADPGGYASVASNQITLAAGTYRIRAQAQCFKVDQHKAKLYNVTDAADIMFGTSAYAGPGSGEGENVTSYSFINGRFTIAATKVLEIQHQCITTVATNGFGVPGSFGTETYTSVELEREP